MAFHLSQVGRQFLLDEKKFIETHRLPVVVWESPPAAPDTRDMELTFSLAGTDELAKPRVGDPLVFELAKGSSKFNAFAMGVTVGRTAGNDIVLPDPSVSRFHAYFQQDPTTSLWNLVDAESKNGTTIDGAKLAPNKPMRVNDHARIVFGNVEVRLLLPDAFVEYMRKAGGT